MGEWQPIETAPKDGVRHYDGAKYGPDILAYPFWGKIVVARWWDANKDGDTRYCNFIADGGQAFRPTHWMPLPEPPTPLEERG